ncbi:hypothetical protein Bcav_2781 [Beutenbergia cavernae DSM 12333]|uniref:Cardiolipin synthase N-terminal domain-containing protein n=1 Tax=Beutenbergia cavernae (strain ATCC BAA-8 / DSM 12333 / CCUG 43141 / JCM 11478 / NBRC 16432 / NCIMB 13614 / HKI 0122) TaxID=471853 RepID=C5BYC6_BEUC1|nr:PLDc N-terminal domain-containing protein [Beutenbergia cavernae]ACQ81026.1 hypothetical protein Bcav_2781 [Beutenbergia cavernae DSM 12333]
MPNTFVPAAYDLVWSGAAVVVLGLAVWALLSLGADRTLTPGVRLLWAVLIVVVPVLGAAAWLLGGRSTPRAAASRGRR